MLALGLDFPQTISFFVLVSGVAFLLAYFVLPKYLAGKLGGLRARTILLILIFVTILVRGVPNALLPSGAGYDIESYELVADALLEGRDVYTDPLAMDRHPYLPFQMYWLAAARWISLRLGGAFTKIVRLAPICADAVIAVLIYRYLANRASSETALQGAFLYALNPVSIFVSSYHGQFDAIPLMFLVIAILAHKHSWSTSGIALGLGILNKSWPVLALPSLVWHLPRWPKRILYGFLAAAVTFLGVLLYLDFSGARVWDVIAKAVGYDWGIGVWGYTYLFRLVGIIRPGANGLFRFVLRYGRFVTLGALALVWSLRARVEPVPESILTVFVTFFAITHAFSIQYLVWLLPLALLSGCYRWLHRYTLAATSYMILVYATLIMASHITNLLPWPQADWFVIMPSSLPAWFVTVLWAASRWVRSGEELGYVS